MNNKFFIVNFFCIISAANIFQPSNDKLQELTRSKARPVGITVSDRLIPKSPREYSDRSSSFAPDTPLKVLTPTSQEQEETMSIASDNSISENQSHFFNRKKIIITTTSIAGSALAALGIYMYAKKEQPEIDPTKKRFVPLIAAAAGTGLLGTAGTTLLAGAGIGFVYFIPRWIHGGCAKKDDVKKLETKVTEQGKQIESLKSAKTKLIDAVNNHVEIFEQLKLAIENSRKRIKNLSAITLEHAKELDEGKKIAKNYREELERNKRTINSIIESMNGKKTRLMLLPETSFKLPEGIDGHAAVPATDDQTDYVRFEPITQVSSDDSESKCVVCPCFGSRPKKQPQHRNQTQH